MTTDKIKTKLPYWAPIQGNKKGVELVFSNDRKFIGVLDFLDFVDFSKENITMIIEPYEYNMLLNLECYYSTEMAVRILGEYLFGFCMYPYPDLSVFDRKSDTKTIPFHSKIVKYSFGIVECDVAEPKEVVVLEIEDNVAVCAEIEDSVDDIDIGLYQLNQIKPIQRNITPECIRSVRKMLGLSQIEFAAFLGFKHAKDDTKRRQVEEWEAGKKIPNMSTQEIIKYIKVHGSKGALVHHLKQNC